MKCYKSFLLVILCFLLPASGLAQTLIRDTETEYLIERYTAPLLEAARLTPDRVPINLINDPSPNAFVTADNTIWLNTGIIRLAPTPEALIGVIAHELGHVTGRHTPEIGKTLKMSRVGAAVMTLIGIGLLAFGEDAATQTGLGLITAAPPVAMGIVHYHSRKQEMEADVAAMNFLDQVGLSARGLLEMLELFHQEEIFATRAGRYTLPQYLSTHPYAGERIQFLRRHLESHPGRASSQELRLAHKMVQAKLKAFLEDPEQVLQVFLHSRDLPGRYARSIALHRLAHTQKALKEIDVLIQMQSNNPFFYELKGQILLENLQPEASLPYYEKAVQLAPHLPLLRLELARALVSTDSPRYLREAIPHLQRLTEIRRTRAPAFRILARARGTLGEWGLAELYTAKYHQTLGNTSQAQLHACRAQKRLQKESPPWRQAYDISTCGKKEKK